jgi:hypothetical protein
MNAIQKKCKDCKEDLPLTEDYFGKQKDRSDGFRDYCKKCMRIRNNNYKEANKQRIAKVSAEYYEKNKNKKFAKGCLWRANEPL